VHECFPEFIGRQNGALRIAATAARADRVWQHGITPANRRSHAVIGAKRDLTESLRAKTWRLCGMTVH